MEPPLSDRQIHGILEPFGLSLDAAQRAALRAYISLLLHWNRTISLTTITNPSEIISRHFGESFFAAASIPLTDGRLADVGSGAGFPGAAIAMLCPKIRAVLIESNSRKAAFLETVRGELKLDNVEIMRARVEDCSSILRNTDFITVRAFGNYPQFLRMLCRRLRTSTRVILWLSAGDAAGLTHELQWDWQPQIHIPGSKSLVLLTGSITKGTD